MDRSLVCAYADLFVHCWDSYAVQQQDGSYRRLREWLSLPRLRGHLQGYYTLGTYLLDQESCCMFAVLDHDGPEGLQALWEVSIELEREGIDSLLEATRRGAHLWVHFVTPTPAAQVRAWLLPSATRLGIELYPKQDVLQRDGPGSLIRLPLGVHRVSGQWYPFVSRTLDGRFVPVSETVAGCCAWATSMVDRVSVPDLVPVYEPAPVPVLTSQQARSLSALSGYPGQGSIRQWCLSQDSVAVIGRYVQLDSRGVGSCPFKGHHHRGDLRPSFQVFGGRDPHWYCHTWGRAGDLFNFLCLFHGLTPQQGWVWLQEGRF